MSQHLVFEIKGLKTHFFSFAGIVKSVDGIYFRLQLDEVLGIV